MGQTPPARIEFFVSQLLQTAPLCPKLTLLVPSGRRRHLKNLKEPLNFAKNDRSLLGDSKVSTVIDLLLLSKDLSVAAKGMVYLLEECV